MRKSSLLAAPTKAEKLEYVASMIGELAEMLKGVDEEARRYLMTAKHICDDGLKSSTAHETKALEGVGSPG